MARLAEPKSAELRTMLNPIDPLPSQLPPPIPNVTWVALDVAGDAALCSVIGAGWLMFKDQHYWIGITYEIHTAQK